MSNEVTVLLALAPTKTPPPNTDAAWVSGPQVAVVTPTSAPDVPAPAGQPPTPTCRPVPVGAGAATATPTPALVAAQSTSPLTPTRPAWASIFWADDYTLKPGECTKLHWSVENVVEVYLNNSPVTGKETRDVCLPQTTTYTLRVVSSAGTQEYPATITVSAEDQLAIEFVFDTYQVIKGQCANLHRWVTNVQKVFFDNQGVAGESTQLCPETDTTYELRVEDGNDAITRKRILIRVLPADSFPMRFWADRYTLQPGACTTLHWNVQNVSEVYLG